MPVTARWDGETRHCDSTRLANRLERDTLTKNPRNLALPQLSSHVDMQRARYRPNPGYSITCDVDVKGAGYARPSVTRIFPVRWM